MHQFATLFQRYALWSQIALILMILLLAILPSAKQQTDAEGYLQLAGSLALPYMISGDRNGLRQALDLIIQNTPILEVRVLSTENRPLIQVFNRSASEQQRNAAEQHTKELVLDQSLLGTLSITTTPASSAFPWGIVTLSALALLLGVGRMFTGDQDSGSRKATPLPHSRTKERYLIAISMAPLIEQFKQEGSGSHQQGLLQKIIRRLAPSYGLEYLTISDEILFLQTHAGEKQALRQAIVFTWNACQSLGAQRGMNLCGTICAMRLAGDPLISNLELLAEDQIEFCTDLLRKSPGGSVSFAQTLATELPEDWNQQRDNDRELCMINELPAALCTLWRRQLSSLADEQ